MASFQQQETSMRPRRSTHAPRRFADEVFAKGSGFVGCDHYDLGYDVKDTTGKQGCVSLEWRWNEDSRMHERAIVDDRPDYHLGDLEGFVVGDDDEEALDALPEDEEEAYSSEDEDADLDDEEEDDDTDYTSDEDNDNQVIFHTRKLNKLSTI